MTYNVSSGTLSLYTTTTTTHDMICIISETKGVVKMSASSDVFSESAQDFEYDGLFIHWFVELPAGEPSRYLSV